jgi:hypothetical protein
MYAAISPHSLAKLYCFKISNARWAETKKNRYFTEPSVHRYVEEIVTESLMNPTYGNHTRNANDVGSQEKNTSSSYIGPLKYCIGLNRCSCMPTQGMN